VVAPRKRAPIIVDRPTPPDPTTTTLEPGCTLARTMAAPRPVLTPQASPHTTSSGASVRTGVTKRSGTTARSA
jgi:hypothetical protein